MCLFVVGCDPATGLHECLGGSEHPTNKLYSSDLVGTWGEVSSHCY